MRTGSEKDGRACMLLFQRRFGVKAKRGGGVSGEEGE